MWYTHQPILEDMGSVASRELGSLASRDFRIVGRDVIMTRFISVFENVFPLDFNDILDRFEDMFVMYASRFMVFGWDKKKQILKAFRRDRVDKYEEDDLTENEDRDWKEILKIVPKPEHATFSIRTLVVAEQIITDRITAIFEEVERDTRPSPDSQEGGGDEGDDFKPMAVRVFPARDQNKLSNTRYGKYRMVVESLAYESAGLFLIDLLSLKDYTRNIFEKKLEMHYHQSVMEPYMADRANPNKKPPDVANAHFKRRVKFNGAQIEGRDQLNKHEFIVCSEDSLNMLLAFVGKDRHTPSRFTKTWNYPNLPNMKDYPISRIPGTFLRSLLRSYLYDPFPPPFDPSKHTLAEPEEGGGEGGGSQQGSEGAVADNNNKPGAKKKNFVDDAKDNISNKWNEVMRRPPSKPSK